MHILFVSGNFGEVYIGQLKDERNESESTLVAIKTIRGVYVSNESESTLVAIKTIRGVYVSNESESTLVAIKTIRGVFDSGEEYRKSLDGGLASLLALERSI